MRDMKESARQEVYKLNLHTILILHTFCTFLVLVLIRISKMKFDKKMSIKTIVVLNQNQIHIFKSMDLVKQDFQVLNKTIL